MENDMGNTFARLFNSDIYGVERNGRSMMINGKEIGSDRDGFIIDGGILYGYVGDAVELRVPLGVRRVKREAFCGNGKLKTVTFSDTVEELEYRAFENCVELAEIRGGRLKLIGAYAFGGCLALKNVKLVNGSLRLGDHAFGGLPLLKNVSLPADTEEIGDGAFADCTELVNVQYGGKLKRMGRDAFKNTPFLKSRGRWLNDGLYLDGVLITAAKQLVGGFEVALGTKLIADGACEGREIVSFSCGDVEYIGADAFGNCKHLKDVTIKSVGGIGDRAFEGCAVEKLCIGSVSVIGDEVFRNCIRLTEVDMESVTDVGEAAFVNCRSLVSAKFSSARRLGRGAFENCIKLKRVEFPLVDELCDDSFRGCGELETTVFSSALRRIGERTFSDCYTLSRFDIPEETVEIGEFAFSGCLFLENVTFSESLRIIGVGAFSGCESLDGFTVPDTVRLIGYKAFDKTGYTLDSANWSDGVIYNGRHLLAVSPDISGDCFLREDTLTVPPRAFAGCGKLTYINIPAAITVITIGFFENCKALRGIGLHDGIEAIEDLAFHNCGALGAVNLPHSLKKIGAGAFRNCFALAELSINGCVHEIGKMAFDSCSALTRVTMSDGVTVIGEQAFAYCSQLERVELSRNVVRIERGAFENCRKLREIRLPESLEFIGERAFNYCWSLAEVSVPDKVERLETRCFGGCRALTSVTLPAALGYLSDKCFEECKALNLLHASADAALRICSKKDGLGNGLISFWSDYWRRMQENGGVSCYETFTESDTVRETVTKIMRGFLLRFSEGVSFSDREAEQWRKIFCYNEPFVSMAFHGDVNYFRYAIAEGMLDVQGARKLLGSVEDASCRSLLLEFIGDSGAVGASAFDDFEL